MIGHDKDTTKTPFYLVPLSFVAAMSSIMLRGLQSGSGRVPFGWQRLDWTLDTKRHYYSALLRHVHAAWSPIGEATSDARASNWASVACNAMIMWFYENQRGRK